MSKSPFYDRLDQVIDAVKADLSENDATFKQASSLELMNGPIAYGETHVWHFILETLKGKNTRKYLHVSVYRTESGRYELTHYYM